MTPEGKIMHDIRAALGRDPRWRVYRNNVGTLIDANGRPVQFGVLKGSSDLLVIMSPHGRAAWLEVKAPGGRVRPEQETWMRVQHELGAFAAIVRSVDEAKAAMERAYAGGVE